MSEPIRVTVQPARFQRPNKATGTAGTVVEVWRELVDGTLWARVDLGFGVIVPAAVGVRDDLAVFLVMEPGDVAKLETYENETIRELGAVMVAEQPCPMCGANEWKPYRAIRTDDNRWRTVEAKCLNCGVPVIVSTNRKAHD